MPAGIKELDKMFLLEQAWHRSEQSEILEVIGIDQILDTFDFDLIKTPVLFEIDGETHIGGFNQLKEDWSTRQGSVDDKVVIARKGGKTFDGQDAEVVGLGVMGNGYRINHYREFFTPIANALLEMGCVIESVGTLGNGSRAFMSVQLPDGASNIDLPGIGTGRNMLNIGDSCDGAVASRAAISLFRMVCLNTMASELLGVPALWRVRHTTNAGDILKYATSMVVGAVEASTKVAAQVDRLAETKFTEAQFNKLVAQLQGDRPEGEGAAQTRFDNKTASIVARYQADDIEGIRDTAWGALNAIQGYSQHVRGTRGVSRDARIINENVFGATDPFLVKAASELNKLVMA